MSDNVVIPDGDNQPLISDEDGQRFFLRRGDSTLVDGAPVLLAEDDNVTFQNAGTAATMGGTSTIVFAGDDGDLRNLRSGEIRAENTAVEVSGQDVDIRNFGLIDGGFNGVNFVNGVESSGSLRNFGTISSDSRAVNIGGDGVELDNRGDILGTGNQRNGTVYSDGSADNFSIRNSGTIDAGAGNLGAGIALQTGDFEGDVVTATIDNRGDIVGRGQGAADTGLAGDGIRIFAGDADVTFQGDITNRGSITSESAVGPTAGLRVANGVNFVGEITNERGGVISGVNNGLYFGTGEHDATVLNKGTISSDSRAVNIDGSGVDLINAGDILGTGNQRNGTVYADATAGNYSITNTEDGLIDAGEGNQGAGIALQTGSFEGDVVSASIENAGEISGRGQAAANTTLAGDGIRVFAGSSDVTFQGDITNSGTITSESEQGATAGVRVANGVNFVGEIVNEEDGVIAGANNGLYFGTGNHDAIARNEGLISSDSRAVNIDGSGVDLINAGDILGTGNQRNGTVYADATADNFSITNTEDGLIDAGEGNNGSGVSLQSGEIDGDTVTASVLNEGLIQGRGDATEGNTVGDGVRIFSTVEGATFEGDVVNNGEIRASEGSDVAVAVSVEDGVTLDGQIVNNGLLSATVTAIDASEANGVTVVNNGQIDGGVILSKGDDVFDGSGSSDGNEITGGLGNDEITGGSGIDTVRYDDIDVPVNVVLDANGNGTATRETGFSVSFADVPVTPLTLNPGLSGDFVTEALAGNLYFNLHTNDFNSGEIRGQLDTIVDNTEHGTGTIVLSGGLDASQEPGPTSDSEATGFGTVTIQVVGGVAQSYSVDLSVTGLATSDLLPVAIFSAIHLHNAPSGVNGPVTLDVVQDAGGDVNGLAMAPDADTGDGNVFAEVVEVDTLTSIENVIGSNDDDQIIGSGGQANQFFGLDGDDFIAGGGGTDVIDGGEGVDTNSFFNINAAAADQTIAGVEVVLNADRSGTAEYIAGGVLGNPVIFEEFEGIENAQGTVNDDRFDAANGVANDLDGLAGDDLFVTDGLDNISGGEGVDTVDFSNFVENTVDNIIGPFNGVIVDLDVNSAGAAGTPGQEGAILNAPPGAVAVGGVVPLANQIQEIDDVENVVGSDFNDGLFGNNEVNVLEGGLGNDVVHGFGGNDFLSGGEGTDTVLFSAAPVGVVVDLTDQVSASDFDAIVAGELPPIIAASGGAGNNVLSGFENVTGSAVGDDDITGDGGANVLSGQGGNDVLNGGGGNDVLIGGAGEDTFVFGPDSGEDTINDFEAEFDLLDLSDPALGFANLQDVLDAAGPSGDDTIIDLGDGNSVTLLDLTIDQLSEDNVLF